MKEKLYKIIDAMRDMLIDDEKRITRQYIIVYIIVTAVSLFMTIINIFTKEHMLMLSTFGFALLNLVNIVLTKKCGSRGNKIASFLFSGEIIVLFLFFVISGIPDGFSVIWICLLPTSGLLLFGRKHGTVVCAIMFVLMVFMFQTPLGQSLLRYPYNTVFKLRFPMLYVAFFAVSFFLETIRAWTNERLRAVQQKYQYLYCHDALTDLYNRYGFNEKIDTLIKTRGTKQLSLMIADIDFFKKVNDTFGHEIGDIVLQKLAEFLQCEASEAVCVCRWGGEEFAILLDGDKNAEAKANEIVEKIARTPICIDDKTISLTISIGLVTVSGSHEISAAELLIRADRCLYRAKDEGRNRVVCEKN